MLDALRYTICTIQAGTSDEDDDFGTFNPCAKIDLSSVTGYLNNISDEEVDKVRAKFGKGFRLEKITIEAKCSHNMNKKWLLTSFYLKCEKCGYEEG